ncbi:DUF805 domain-containing protein [Rhodovulum sulfidophilum]|uniref:DUF805 domain-containing protein n=1 Tax=Rhodovulum sulfidophilum TaxID=35806 RepID=UPI001924EC70|nr:DUF805 domain-containing protein [Rhodovulum sulfidophilum]MBL3575989.1 DUF805 domain-containing protein [Rhodovulum sulfidophilum]MCE8433093.1 DUF805 domain-containing protein [Rhodovulum sulfidophilum]
MTFGQALRTCRRKFARFGGRASRAEYWYLVLAFVVANWVAGTRDYMFFDGRHPFGVFVAGIAFLPMTSAGWRRLHDVNRRGWWLLLPGIASLIFLVGAFVIRGLSGRTRPPPDADDSRPWRTRGHRIAGLAVLDRAEGWVIRQVVTRETTLTVDGSTLPSDLPSRAGFRHRKSGCETARKQALARCRARERA